jgi:hypothetical protein
LLGDGFGNFGPAVYYFANGGGGQSAIGDLDGDGKPDVAVFAVGGVTLIFNQSL